VCMLVRVSVCMCVYACVRVCVCVCLCAIGFNHNLFSFYGKKTALDNQDVQKSL